MKVFLLLSALSLPFSCAHAPKAGDACAEDLAVCQGPAAAIICRAGVYVATGCRGAQGCVRAADRKVTCDQTSGAVDGEPCLPGYDAKLQCSTTDPSSYLVCTSASWIRRTCVTGVCMKAGGNITCQ